MPGYWHMLRNVVNMNQWSLVFKGSELLSTMWKLHQRDLFNTKRRNSAFYQCLTVNRGFGVQLGVIFVPVTNTKILWSFDLRFPNVVPCFLPIPWDLPYKMYVELSWEYLEVDNNLKLITHPSICFLRSHNFKPLQFVNERWSLLRSRSNEELRWKIS